MRESKGVGRFPPTVLICEDDELMRRLITVVLASEGYDLREAWNVEGAHVEMDRRPPDLVILDNRMPGQGGAAVLERIRSDPTLAATRVLLVSGASDALESGWAERVGADAHLSKPFALETFKATVRGLLNE